jgi:hypothetical protein
MKNIVHGMLTKVGRMDVPLLKPEDVDCLPDIFFERGTSSKRDCD